MNPFMEEVKRRILTKNRLKRRNFIEAVKGYIDYSKSSETTPLLKKLRGLPRRRGSSERIGRKPPKDRRKTFGYHSRYKHSLKIGIENKGV